MDNFSFFEILFITQGTKALDSCAKKHVISVFLGITLLWDYKYWIWHYLTSLNLIRANYVIRYSDNFKNFSFERFSQIPG